MICHRKECIFIHQRKCAGSVIKEVFFKEATPSERLFLVDGALSPKADIDLYFAKYRHYTLFTVVRNPWDRFVSGWHYLKKLNQQKRTYLKSKQTFDPQWSIRETLAHLPYLTGHGFRHIACPQTVLLRYNGTWLPAVILRYESLQADFNALCARLGIVETRLPVINKTKHDHYSAYYDVESFMAVADYFKTDIEKFNYCFEAFK